MLTVILKMINKKDSSRKLNLFLVNLCFYSKALTMLGQTLCQKLNFFLINLCLKTRNSCSSFLNDEKAV